jgi:flavin reductase (DIM6/NTAB) family NADH-FMN oxidoreductase RutF
MDYYFYNMRNLDYRVDIDYDAAPMSTLTLQGKRPRDHTGPLEEAGSPVHLISITGTRKTYRNLLETEECVANFLSPSQENVEKMYVLSDGRYPRGNDKIRVSRFTLEDSQVVGVPRIVEAMAWIEYRLLRMIEIPESERPIFLLKPVAAYALEGLVNPKTYVYCTEVVPIGQLSANICSGRTERLVAKNMTGGKEFTPQEHWAYSDGIKIPT